MTRPEPPQSPAINGSWPFGAVGRATGRQARVDVPSISEVRPPADVPVRLHLEADALHTGHDQGSQRIEVARSVMRADRKALDHQTPDEDA